MANVKFFNAHPDWEDYLDMLLGVLIVLSPVFAGYEVASAVMINAGIIGVLVLALASFELLDLRRWEEILELLCGLWLIASPFMLGYANGALMIWHMALGAIVALLAVAELWQDWRLSDQDLAAHGH